MNDCTREQKAKVENVAAGMKLTGVGWSVVADKTVLQQGVQGSFIEQWMNLMMSL